MRPLRLKDVEVITFDCYGTLIDWENGAKGTLRALAAMKFVRHPQNQRQLRADDGKVGPDTLGQPRQCGHVFHLHRLALRELGHPRVSRGAQQLLDPRALLQFPRQGMLAAAAADD